MSRMQSAAKDASIFVWDSLEEIIGRRIPIREDAITSFMLNEIGRHMDRHAKNTFYFKDTSPTENINGADFEIYVKDSTGILGWAFQAKHPKVRSSSTSPQIGNIPYEVGKNTGIYQHNLLAAHTKANGLGAYYLFYLGWPAPRATLYTIQSTGSALKEYGCATIPLSNVIDLIKDPNQKSTALSHFEPALFPWQNLFKAGISVGGSGGAPPSGPDDQPPSRKSPSYPNEKSSPAGDSDTTRDPSAKETDSNQFLLEDLPWYVRALQKLYENEQFSTEGKRSAIRTNNEDGDKDLIALLNWAFPSDYGPQISNDDPRTSEAHENEKYSQSAEERDLGGETEGLSQDTPVENKVDMKSILQRLSEETGVEPKIFHPTSRELIEDNLEILTESFPRRILVI